MEMQNRIWKETEKRYYSIEHVYNVKYKCFACTINLNNIESYKKNMNFTYERQ